MTPEDFPTLRAVHFKELNQEMESEQEHDMHSDDVTKHRFGGAEKDDTENISVESVGEFIDLMLADKLEKYVKT